MSVVPSWTAAIRATRAPARAGACSRRTPRLDPHRRCRSPTPAGSARTGSWARGRPGSRGAPRSSWSTAARRPPSMSWTRRGPSWAAPSCPASSWPSARWRQVPRLLPAVAPRLPDTCHRPRHGGSHPVGRRARTRGGHRGAAGAHHRGAGRFATRPTVVLTGGGAATLGVHRGRRPGRRRPAAAWPGDARRAPGGRAMSGLV